MSDSFRLSADSERVAALFADKPPVLVEVRFPGMGTSPDWYLCENRDELIPILDRLGPGVEIHLHSVQDLTNPVGDVVLKKQRSAPHADRRVRIEIPGGSYTAMNADLWLTSSDPEALWQSLPAISDRKARLWMAACCRLLVAPTTRTQRYEQHPGIYPASVRLPSIEAAEEYADGVIDRATLRQTRRKYGSGGPYNIFFIISGVQGFSPDSALRAVWACCNEFSTPTPDEMCGLMRDVFGNPFRPVVFDPCWQTSDAVGLARAMYESRNFSAMSILADALEDAGCDSADVLAHCRGDGPHVRGCWVVDHVLGKS